MHSAVNETLNSLDRTRRPIIGITAVVTQIKFAIFEMDATFVPQTFVQKVADAGCIPVLLAPQPGIEQAVDGLDGLLMLAGPDADPELYGQEKHEKTGWNDKVRDRHELALLEAALASDLPTLGICRGEQLMNILRGGTLHQHLPEIVGHDNHSPGGKEYGQQKVRLEPGSHLAKFLAKDVVPCHHHQVIDEVGEGLTVTAWSEDGTVEAIEVNDHPFAVGVQWHAEESDDDSPFTALAEAARQRMTVRRG
ncbi:MULTISPECIES: gamma-glutamyl-gamma-aminobutyrate hydrolase family protein [Streptomyces]|uniref:Gamma-glutamyl-gamma-aminobutyrate hydrolase family protein n=1 Tax=Streptomyces noboritoensis TaxID=67337 RepID=A0ABV6TIP7_9ACTN|nr:gamma-glutamyl-gamma-aminobutyrate hydrolase family protein [Streptomyces melanogenes]GGP65970.1 gamma-glutamyl-gamma-aminobutyrate hydrolase [Streptomyces melanogenes]